MLTKWILKKIWWRTIVWFWQHREGLSFSLNQFYKAMLISKQAVHKHIEKMQQQMEIEAHLVYVVHQIGKDHPTMSMRSMYYMIKPEAMGRDRFEQFCSQQGFYSTKPKNYGRTTNSHGVIRFDNLLQDMKITAINQAWVSDITYFDVKGFIILLLF